MGRHRVGAVGHTVADGAVTLRENTAEPGAFAELLRAAPTTVLPLGGITSDELIPLAEELLEFAGDDWTRKDLACQVRSGDLAGAEATYRRIVEPRSADGSSATATTSRT